MKLPDLSETNSIQLIACGSVVTKDEALLDWLKQDRTLICSFRHAGMKFFARLMTGSFSEHFHLEVVSAEFFTREPKTTAKRKEVEETADKLIGEKISVSVSSTFVVPASQLSETGVIRMLSTEMKVAGVSMKLTGGLITLSGSPVTEIEWRVNNREDTARVRLDAEHTAMISNDYLVEQQKWAQSLFQLTVLQNGK